MKKGITKEHIVDAALALADGQTMPMHTVGFRDIARLVGCAHTNLYNYFDSYDALLWAAQEEILRRLQSAIEVRLEQAAGFFDALEAFFGGMLDMYLAHPGWFYLAWHERLQTPRPKSHYDLTVSTVDAMVAALTAVFERAGQHVDAQDMRMNLHNVHAYIHGELSIYLAGRGLLREEAPFREYTVRQAARMLRLLADGRR